MTPGLFCFFHSGIFCEIFLGFRGNVTDSYFLFIQRISNCNYLID
jgi:hypothetical protein